MLATDLLLRISFREMPAGRMAIVRQRQLKFSHDFLSGDDPFFYTFSFDVAPADYQVIVEIEDHLTRRSYLESIPHSCRDLSAPVALSDPQLIQEFGEILAPQPLLGEHFTAVPEHLNMSVSVYAKTPGFYRAKAVLYLRENASQVGPIDAEQSQCMPTSPARSHNQVPTSAKDTIQIATMTAAAVLLAGSRSPCWTRARCSASTSAGIKRRTSQRPAGTKIKSSR